MTTSWNRCVEFSNVAQSYLKRTEGRETKFKYALNRTLTRIQRQQEFVNEKISDIEIDHCLTEKRGENDVIVRDSYGNLQYTKDFIKERNKKTREFLNAESVEIDPYFAAVLPLDLNELEIEAFSGFVIKTEDAERLLQELEAKAEEHALSSNGDRAVAALIVS